MIAALSQERDYTQSNIWLEAQYQQLWTSCWLVGFSIGPVFLMVWSKHLLMNNDDDDDVDDGNVSVCVACVFIIGDVVCNENNVCVSSVR